MGSNGWIQRSGRWKQGEFCKLLEYQRVSVEQGLVWVWCFTWWWWIGFPSCLHGSKTTQLHQKRKNCAGSDEQLPPTSVWEAGALWCQVSLSSSTTCWTAWFLCCFVLPIQSQRSWTPLRRTCARSMPSWCWWAERPNESEWGGNTCRKKHFPWSK